MKKVEFYAISTQTGKRRKFSFRVNSRPDAINALKRFNVKSGWYVNGQTSERITN